MYESGKIYTSTLTKGDLMLSLNKKYFKLEKCANGTM